MSTFTAKAFVRIKDDSKRNEIVKTLERIGYECLYGGSVGDNVIVIKDGMMAIDYAMPCDCINCLEYVNNDEDLAVKLFLALSEMRDSFNARTWVKWESALMHDFLGIPIFAKGDITQLSEWLYCDKKLYSILTPEQLAEAVLSGAITKKQLTYK